MADMKHPLLGSVVSVPDDSVERFTAAGYAEVKQSESKSSSSTTKSTSKRTSRKS